MRVASAAIICAIALLFAPATGAAQDRRIHANIGGGPTFLLGDLGERFSTGWGPAFGITFDPTDNLGVQFEYAYRWFNLPEDTDIALGRLSANHQTHQLAFNLVANLTPRDSNARFYVTVGPGMYHRTVEITEYVGNGVICDPYLYVCGTYPVDAVIGSRSGWDFGFNVGAGFGRRLGESSEFYVETRYHYVWGPEITSNTQLPAGTTSTGGSTNATYWPLTFGFRF